MSARAMASRKKVFDRADRDHALWLAPEIREFLDNTLRHPMLPHADVRFEGGEPWIYVLIPGMYGRRLTRIQAIQLAKLFRADGLAYSVKTAEVLEVALARAQQLLPSPRAST